MTQDWKHSRDQDMPMTRIQKSQYFTLNNHKMPKKYINSPRSKPEETFPPPLDRVRLEQ
jgi:hypothetical protein